MKKPLKIIISILLIAFLGGMVWWQLNKKGLIRHRIEKAVANGTDSTYYIHYDSSRIDELSGSAVFYNLVLQSDSLQKQLYTDDTADIARMIFNVRIEKLFIGGANIPSFLQKNTIEAKTIEITKPVITVVNTGKDVPVTFTAADTLALYEKITGRFKSIQADEIKITEGRIAFAKGKKTPHATLEGINISLRNLRIDSTRNYDNLLSYFIKDVNAKVRTALVKNDKGNRLLYFSGIEYNAPGRFLKTDTFKQTNLNTHEVIISLANLRAAGLSTDAFIRDRRLKADSLTTDGGILGFYRGKGKSASLQSIEIDNDFFDEALVKNIRVGSTTLTLFNRADVKAAPMILKNMKFNAAGIDSIYNGTDLLQLIGNSKWNFSADGISFISNDKIYRINIGPFLLDNANRMISVQYATVTPMISRDAFVRSLTFQKDLYDLRFNEIRLTGADVRKLLTEQQVIAEEASLQPILHIFNDRTVTPDTASKLGMYPQQLLQKIKTGIYVKTIRAKNGYIHYKERGALSKQTGDVIFNNAQGVISNFTNIESYKKKNGTMTMKVTAKFLDMAETNSSWILPLNAADGSFEIMGTIGPFSGPKLNPVIEPLGMGTIKSGNIKSYRFDMHGNDMKAWGECTLLYDHLKIRLLKNTGDTIKNKTALSLLANVLIKDQNPSGNNVRKGSMAFNRVMTKTFFNLVWKSIFAGAKSSTK